jgi:hypothetical protein
VTFFQSRLTAQASAQPPPPLPPLQEDHLRPTHMCVFVRPKRSLESAIIQVQPSMENQKLFLFYVVYEACIQKLAAYSNILVVLS